MTYTRKYKGRKALVHKKKQGVSKKQRGGKAKQRGSKKQSGGTLRDPALYNPVVDVIHSPEDPYAAPMLMSRENRDELYGIEENVGENANIVNASSNNKKVNKTNWSNVMKNNKAI
jgi:hypothetical protein